jgi:Mrp family chromosome partitioning ATPase/uncharacterized protein involved in exopolysaccharide biosynthesis
VFLLLGFFVSSLSYKQIWEAETVLLYKVPPAPVEGDPYQSPSLTTQMDMIKMQANLEEIRKRLKLSAPLKSIAAACEVSLKKGTTLIIIHVEWDSANGASDLANTFRDVFLESQINIRREEATKQERDLAVRLQKIQDQLKEADAKLLQYTTANQVVDLSKQAQWTLEQLNSIDLMLEQAQIDQQTNDLQLKNIERIIADLKKRVESEQVESSSQMEFVTVNNVRLQRLREAISDDKIHRSRMAELAEKEVQYESAKKLQERGLISEIDFAKAKAEYERLKAIAVDTPQIQEWKGEITKLDQVVKPSKGGSASAPILQNMLMRQFELELQKTSLGEKVIHLQEARTKVKAALDAMPKLEREFVALSRQVSALESEQKGIEDMLAKSRRVESSEASDYTIVAEAKLPIAPLKSNRKLIFIAVASLGVVIGLALVVGLELLDSTIKSSAEMKLKLGQPVLGAIPRLPRGDKLFVSTESALIENIKIISKRIRRAVPQKGARILLVSATHGEGTTWVAMNLAASFGRQGEHVLLLDSQVRLREDSLSLRNLVMESDDSDEGIILSGDVEAEVIERVRRVIGPFRKRLPEFIKPTLRFARTIIKRLIATASSPTAIIAQRVRQLYQSSKRKRWADGHGLRDIIKNNGQTGGLGEYLDFSEEHIEDILWQTSLSGVDCLPQVSQPVQPEKLGSQRMRQLLEGLSERFDIVLLDSPPVLSYVDAELLAEQCDAIVFVAQSRVCTKSTLNKALQRIAQTNTPMAGLILNGVDPLYMESEQ